MVRGRDNGALCSLPHPTNAPLSDVYAGLFGKALSYPYSATSWKHKR